MGVPESARRPAGSRCVCVARDPRRIRIPSTRTLTVILFWCLGAQAATSSTDPDFKRVCYFTNWSCDLLVKEAHYCLRHIDASLCSHVIYSFADINVTSLSLTPSRVDDETKGEVTGRYVLFNQLKSSHPKLKTLLSVGGSYKSADFKAVTSSPTSRLAFAARSVAYVRRWGFDGLDVDWEYPDREDSLDLLLKDIRQADADQRNSTTDPALVLSVAGPASEELVDKGFDVTEISRYVDFINLMAYDLQGSWSHVTGFNSPLYPRENDARFKPQHCVEWVVDMWVRNGAPPSKIVLGIAGYGQSYTLSRISNYFSTEASSTNNTATTHDSSTFSSIAKRVESKTPSISAQLPSPSSPTTRTTTTPTTTTITTTTTTTSVPVPGPGSHSVGPGRPGRLRLLNGQLSYPEICDYIRQGGRVSWDNQQRVPYMSLRDLWVGYDDRRSVSEKVTWAYSHGLGGVMFWSMDLDDFTGNYCKQGRYPLLTAISNTVVSLVGMETHHHASNAKQNESLDSTDYVVMHGEIRPLVSGTYINRNADPVGDNGVIESTEIFETNSMRHIDHRRMQNNFTSAVDSGLGLGLLSAEEPKQDINRINKNIVLSTLRERNASAFRETSDDFRSDGSFFIATHGPKKARVDTRNREASESGDDNRHHRRPANVTRKRVYRDGYLSDGNTNSKNEKNHGRPAHKSLSNASRNYSFGRNRTERPRTVIGTSKSNQRVTKSGKNKTHSQSHNRRKIDEATLPYPNTPSSYDIDVFDTSTHALYDSEIVRSQSKETGNSISNLFFTKNVLPEPNSSSKTLGLLETPETDRVSHKYNSKFSVNPKIPKEHSNNTEFINTMRKPDTMAVGPQYDTFSVYDDIDDINPVNQFDFYYIAFKLTDAPNNRPSAVLPQKLSTSLWNIREDDSTDIKEAPTLTTKTPTPDDIQSGSDKIMPASLSSAEQIKISTYKFTTFCVVMVVMIIELY